MYSAVVVSSGVREDFGVAGIVLILLAVLFGAGSLIGSTS